jgi:hypothetical protein
MSAGTRPLCSVTSACAIRKSDFAFTERSRWKRSVFRERHLRARASARQYFEERRRDHADPRIRRLGRKDCRDEQLNALL